MKTFTGFYRLVCFLLFLQGITGFAALAQTGEKDYTVKNDFNDRTYGGKGNSHEEFKKDGSGSTKDVYDDAGNLREHYSTLIFKFMGKYKRIVINVFYNCHGKKSYESTETFDKDSVRIGNDIKIYNSGKKISATKWNIDEKGKMHSETYNPATGEMVEDKLDVSRNETPYVRNTSSCPPPFTKNQLLGGFTLIREDSKPTSFNTIGGDLVFEHYYPNGLGYTAEAAVTTGSNSGTKYTKELVLVGAVARILNKPQRKATLSADVHVLGGVSFIQSSFGTYKNSSTSFTADAGANVDLSFGKSLAWRILQVDYLPTFAKSRVQNNVKFTTGFVLKMHSHTEERQTIE